MIDTDIRWKMFTNSPIKPAMPEDAGALLGCLGDGSREGGWTPARDARQVERAMRSPWAAPKDHAGSSRARQARSA